MLAKWLARLVLFIKLTEASFAPLSPKPIIVPTPYCKYYLPLSWSG